MFDFSQFFSVSVAGIPLTILVALFVEVVKRAGVQGKALFFSSLGIGVVLGVGYQISNAGIPANFAGYFAYIVYGLALGGLASIGFDGAKELVKKATGKALADFENGEG